MQMDPELEALGAELQRLGTTVVSHGDHLCVRLPFFTSVRVRLRGGRLQFESRFGPASRDWAMFGSTAVLGGASAWIFASHGPSAAAFAFAFLGVMSGAFNLARLVLSESAITRVQLLRAVRVHGVSSPAAPSHLDALPDAPLDDAPRELAAPAPPFAEPPLRTTDRLTTNA
jgi:hypothetical protein